MEDPGGQILATLLGHTVQHVGAERALLIVRRADETRIEAEATTQPDTIVVRRLDTLPGPSDLPDTVLRYVLRTREAVMLDDTSVTASRVLSTHLKTASGRSRGPRSEKHTSELQSHSNLVWRPLL